MQNLTLVLLLHACALNFAFTAYRLCTDLFFSFLKSPAILLIPQQNHKAASAVCYPAL